MFKSFELIFKSSELTFISFEHNFPAAYLSYFVDSFDF